jgi:predicted DNA-binding WGR domain protein
VRRFELVKKNEAKFWEIQRHQDVLVVRTGKLDGKSREKHTEFDDDAGAEVEFDKQIHTKRRQGWSEVEEASPAPAPFEERAVELRPLNRSTPMRFEGPAMKYLLWRMVEVGICDRHRAPQDLSRWEGRAARQLGIEGSPALGSRPWKAWRTRVIELSARDRAAPMQDDMVGCFKFREGSHWIVTPEECVFIGREAAGRKPKRKKETEEHAQWVAAWSAFHEAQKEIGYEVVPV